MRSLKFRAWDKSVEHLYEVQTLIDGGDAIGRYVLNGEMRYIHLCADEIIVEQYTGLKDKNGKEIYEGDIVRFRAVYHGKYLEDVGGVSMRELPDSDGWENDGYLCWAIDDYISLSCADTEVIGNIHENQDLLDAANTINKE